MHLYILLSDVPLTDDLLPRNDRANGRVSEMVRENRIHAFELHFSDLGKTLYPPENGAIYHNGVQPARFGHNGFVVYRQTAFDGQWLEGQVRMDADNARLAGFAVEGTFRVRVPPKP